MCRSGARKWVALSEQYKRIKHVEFVETICCAGMPKWVLKLSFSYWCHEHSEVPGVRVCDDQVRTFGFGGQ